MTLHEQVLEALSREPKPITEARALAVAVEIIGNDGKAAEQFREWFKVNSAILLKMLEPA